MISIVEANNNQIVFHGAANEPVKTITNSTFSENEISPEFFEFGKVEVLLDVEHPNLWYEAYVFNIQKFRKADSVDFMFSVVMAVNNEDAQVTLSSIKDVKNFPIEQIRLAPKLNPELTVSENDLVEVRVNENGICWKLAKVKMSKDDCIALQFIKNSDPQNGNVIDPSDLGIVSRNDTRILNNLKSLSNEWNPFFGFEIPIEPNLFPAIQNDSSWISKHELHKDFKKCLSLINVTFNSENMALVCLGFSLTDLFIFEQKVRKRAKMLSSMHFNKLTDYYRLCESRLKTKNFLVTSGNVSKEGDIIVNVIVAEHLIGLAIGKNGSQIQKARSVEGIKSIDLEENTKTFTIKGESKEACLKAASFLNFIQQFVDYSKEYSNFFNDKETIQELVELSGIIRININHKEDNVTVEFIGTSETVENLKILFDFQLYEWKEIKLLRMKAQRLNQQVNSSDLHLSHNGDSRSDDFTRRQSGKYLTGNNRSFNRAPKNFAEVVKGGVKLSEYDNFNNY